MHAAASASSSDHDDRHEVVVLGAGMSGLCTAIQLKRAGIDDFVVLEQSAGLGGTWWDNRYPGAHVDVPAPLYCFSFAPNAHWQRRFAAAPEIQAYMQHCARKYAVLPHLRLHTRITAARWDEAGGRWHIATLCEGQARTLQARFFVCSLGPLSRPRWPDIPGLDEYTGTRLHSARWDAKEPLQGRRIGVIGTGSTAAQLIPPLAGQAAAMTVFQRTANWVLPRIDRRYGPLDHALARLPPYSAAVRWAWMALLEWGRRGFEEGTMARRGMLRTAAAHRRRAVQDPALLQALTPSYPLGCKRLIYSNDYYPALASPHVSVVTAAITRITPAGVQTVDGREHTLDVLVCATGFDVEHALGTLAIHGRGGRLLADDWRDGPRAHLGLTVPGYPNLFLMLGPNTATGHTSTLLYIEPGVRWAIRAMQQLRQRQQAWLDLKPEVLQAADAAMQARLQRAVWSQCRSWYRAGSGRNIAIWPGYTREYQRAVAAQRWSDFEFGPTPAAG